MTANLADRWQALKEIFGAALEVPPDERDAFAANACRGDGELLAQARRLLAIHRESSLALDHPVVTGTLLDAVSMPAELAAGRFQIVRQLGAGGMGEVYEAEDKALNIRLALKTIRGEHARQPTYLERMREEIRLLREVTHPNVCRVFDFFPGDAAQPTFFTMELVAGESLAARLERAGPLAAKEADALFRQVLDALAAAHAQGIIHRDLKPANIMLGRNAEGGLRAVLMDFGVAQAPAKEPTRATGVTAPVGTPAYMSPEQLEAGALTPPSDLYSFALVACEAASGKPLFTGATALAVVARKLTTPAATLVQPLPRRWRKVILRCLAAKPEARYASAAQVRRALFAKKARRWPFAVAASMLLIAVLVEWTRMRPAEEALRVYEEGVAALGDTATERALGLFEKAIERSPNFALAHARKAQAHALLDAPDLAREAMLRAMEERRRTWLLAARDRRVFDAIRALVTRDFQTAAERFESAGSLLDAGAARELNEQPDLARRHYLRLLEKDAGNATAHLRLASLATRRQDTVAALTALDQAQKGYERLTHKEGVAETWLRRGSAYAGVSRNIEARQALETAERFAADNGLAAYQVRAQLALSAVAAASGQMGEAERRARAALEMARARNQEWQVVYAMNDLAFAYLTQQRLKESQRLAEHALELAARFRQPRSAARARLLLMNTLYYQGGEARLSEAKSYGGEALKFYREAGYRRQQMETLMMLGRLETASQNFGAAEAMFARALEAARAAGDAQTMGLAEQGLATAAEAQGRLDAALDHLQRAEAAYRGAGRSGHLAYALAAKAELLYELSRPGGREAMDEAARLAATNPRLGAMLSLVRAQREAANGNWTEASRQWRLARAAADESAGRRARLDALEAWIGHRANPARAAALCGKVMKAVDSGLALDDRAAATFACAEAVRIPALPAVLRDLASSPNRAVARKARFYLARGDKQ